MKEILVIISRIFLTDIYDERLEFDQLTGIAISSSAVTRRNLLIMNFMDFISDGNEYLHCLCWRGLGVAPAHNLQHIFRYFHLYPCENPEIVGPFNLAPI